MTAAEETGSGTLYVVATPIGNLGDISARAIETLRQVSLIAAEDTRHTRRLLTHFQLQTRLVSYHSHNRRARAAYLLEALAQGDVALVSDAGTPVVSDPGQELVRLAAAAGHSVVAIPGPSALTAAISISGIDAEAVHFVGFLPRRSTERKRALESARAWPGVLVCFEAPHRLEATLADILESLGDTEIAVCCELTKLFEQVFRGPVSEAIAHYASRPAKGEFTLVVKLNATPPAPEPAAAERLESRFETLVQQTGDRKRALAALAQETGQPRKALYAQLMLRPSQA